MATDNIKLSWREKRRIKRSFKKLQKSLKRCAKSAKKATKALKKMKIKLGGEPNDND